MTSNVLFVCGKNRLRSPTAEQVFASWPGVDTACVVCLDIPDDYDFMDPALVRVLQSKVSRHLPAGPGEKT